MNKNIILGLILCLGLASRCYHLNFPSIGYHNMKENEYLSMAEEMIRTKDFITRRIYFYNAFEEEPTMKLYPQPPLISYQTLISWKLLGDNLWGPRLFNVLFGLASIVVIYLIALLLFKEIKWALFCAFLLAIMPLGVFFSRNLQPESPAFFFMLLGSLFYLKFTSSFKKYDLFLGGLFLTFACLYKLSFLIAVLALIFCLPFKVLFKEKREFIKYILIFLFLLSVIIIAILWLIYIKHWEFDYPATTSDIRLFEIFFSSYWRNYGFIIWWYIKENYTLVIVSLALLGIICACVRKKGLLNRYIIGWVLSIMPYVMIFSNKINQHNYYQMPFLGMVCIASVYAVSFATESAKKITKKSIFVYLITFLVVLSLPMAYFAIRRMYGKVFLGEDVAGRSLKEFTLANERIFLLTFSQGYGVARYAQRYAGWPESLEDFKDKEEKFKIRYVCIYPTGFSENLKDNSLMLSYFQNNYHLKELGMIKIGKVNYEIVYSIYERGNGETDVNKFIYSNLDKIKLRTTYMILGKSFPFYAIRAM
jgi:4-amino-4-deoxy-L-arabinose transferase-like glycosyltransferase